MCDHGSYCLHVKHPPVLIKIYLMWFRNAQSFTDEVIFQFDFEFDSLTFSWKLKRQATKSKTQEAAIFICVKSLTDIFIMKFCSAAETSWLTSSSPDVRTRVFGTDSNKGHSIRILIVFTVGKQKWPSPVTRSHRSRIISENNHNMICFYCIVQPWSSTQQNTQHRLLVDFLMQKCSILTY